MADAQFFINHGPFTLAHLAHITGAQLRQCSTPELLITDVAPLDKADTHQVSFLDNPKYIASFQASAAAACFVREKYAASAPPDMALLVHADPYYAFAVAASAFYPEPNSTAEISPHAHIHPTATIGVGCSIAPGAVIAERVTLGDHCVIGANTVIHTGVSIAKHTRIGACSTISHAIIGSHVIIHRGVHIGQDGFGFAAGTTGMVKVPQLGRVVIDDYVEIGSGTTIDRGTGPDTHIGAGTKIDNLVQIGHNVQVGRHCVIVAQVGISGSTRLGDGVVLGGQVGLAGHIKIGAGAKIAAQSGVMADIPAGQNMGGSPAVPIKDWHRQTIAISKLIRKKEG